MELDGSMDLSRRTQSNTSVDSAGPDAPDPDEEALRSKVDLLSAELQDTIERLTALGLNSSSPGLDDSTGWVVGGAGPEEWDSILYATETGPVEVPVEQIENLLVAQTISMDTMVLAEGMNSWCSLGEFIYAYAAEDEQQDLHEIDSIENRAKRSSKQQAREDILRELHKANHAELAQKHHSMPVLMSRDSLRSIESVDSDGLATSISLSSTDDDEGLLDMDEELGSSDEEGEAAVSRRRARRRDMVRRLSNASEMMYSGPDPLLWARMAAGADAPEGSPEFGLGLELGSGGGGGGREVGVLLAERAGTKELLGLVLRRVKAAAAAMDSATIGGMPVRSVAGDALGQISEEEGKVPSIPRLVALL